MGLSEQPFQRMTATQRLLHLGSFHADTSQFVDAKAAVLRLYDAWQTAKDGHILVLHGESGVGKTTVIDEAILSLADRDNAPQANRGGHSVNESIAANGETFSGMSQGRRQSVVKVFVEPMVRKRGFLRDTLQALGVGTSSRETYGELMERLKVQIIGQGVRLLIFDEMHHVVEGHGPKTAYEAVEVLKMLLLQTRVQIVCVGLGITETILDVNPELPRHCRGRIRMSPLICDTDNPNSDHLRFLAALSKNLPFDCSPNLASTDMALRIHCGTGGFIGHITNLIQGATQLAIEFGHDTLSLQVLEEAYQLIEGAGWQDNPFSSHPLSPDRILAIQKAFTKRRRKRWMRFTRQ